MFCTFGDLTYMYANTRGSQTGANKINKLLLISITVVSFKPKYCSDSLQAWQYVGPDSAGLQVLIAGLSVYCDVSSLGVETRSELNSPSSALSLRLHSVISTVWFCHAWHWIKYLIQTKW